MMKNRVRFLGRAGDAMSWIIEETATGKAVLETFNKSIAGAINTDRYRVWSAQAWLVELNRRIKIGGGV